MRGLRAVGRGCGWLWHRLIANPCHWILVRTFRRYNIVKIKSLVPGYYDVDTRLIHAAFDLLVEFVEKEQPFDAIDWEASGEGHAFAAQEIKDLYTWWKKVYPSRKNPLDALDKELIPPRFRSTTGLVPLEDQHDGEFPSYQQAIEDTWRLEQEWAEEDTRNFVRLIRIRGYLWV